MQCQIDKYDSQTNTKYYLVNRTQKIIYVVISTPDLNRMKHFEIQTQKKKQKQKKKNINRISTTYFVQINVESDLLTTKKMKCLGYKEDEPLTLNKISMTTYGKCYKGKTVTKLIETINLLPNI